jgi:hypothetical protein
MLFGIYVEMFRSMCRFFQSVHGARVRPEYLAALALASFAALNLNAASRLSAQYFGVGFIPTDQLWFFCLSLLLLFLLHYLMLVRGVEEDEFLRPSRRNLSGLGTLGYVVATAAFCLWAT